VAGSLKAWKGAEEDQEAHEYGNKQFGEPMQKCKLLNRVCHAGVMDPEQAMNEGFR
jgi:hypothetical protein